MPNLIRNVVVCGHLHHGKTTLIDMLLNHTHLSALPRKFTDNRKDEFLREMSIKLSPASFLVNDSRDKSFLFHWLDTPGHPNFCDEVAVGMRLADVAVIVVDVIEGVTLYV